MLPLVLLVLGIVSRLLVHAPNFTPVMAIALFSAVYLERKYAVILPLVLMMLSDLILGMYDGIFFTWLAVLAVAYVGLWVRGHKSVTTILGGGFAASLIFFVVSNLGVWASGYYGYSWQGLGQCYVAAIPFYRDTLTSTLIYSAVLFGIYEFIFSRVQETRLARVLLR